MYISKKGWLTCLAMMAMSMGFLTSCSKEEEDLDSGEGSVTQTDTSNFDGTHLIAIGNGGDYDTHFNYNADGSIHQIVMYATKVVFDYTTGTVTFIDSTDELKGNFTTNEKGYITELSQSGSDEYDDYSVVWKFQYNSSGHLTNAAYNDVVISHATNEKETTDVTWEFTWNGDLLSSIKTDGFDGYERWGGITNFSYTDAVENRYMQYTDAVINFIDFDGDLEEFMYVGLFGKSSSKYPSKIENEWKYAHITYELNSKGLVERERAGYNGDDSFDASPTEYLYDGIPKASAPAADNKVGVDKKRHMDSRNHISPFRRKK